MAAGCKGLTADNENSEQWEDDDDKDDDDDASFSGNYLGLGKASDDKPNLLAVLPGCLMRTHTTAFLAAVSCIGQAVRLKDLDAALCSYLTLAAADWPTLRYIYATSCDPM